ncbi:MAG TPA: bifunctional diguanylate cyclase/phosphodiesterase, partial [Nitrococcus sp.]|nr:bifunctional diguanylate cyclase/phosphodiesterase [Nitrococcus sp.]
RNTTETYLGYLAHYDPLTTLPNRLLFRDRLDQAMAGADWQRRRVALHIIDLDHFKLINEGLGHVQGNQVLHSTAQRLGSAAHQGDTLARIGGDKFALIQTSLYQVEQSAFRAQHMLDVIEPTLTVLGGRELHISASIGIAIYPDDGGSAADLMHNAGLALSRAKMEGRKSYRFFVRGMEEKVRARCALEHDMGRALAHGEFLFHYQPQVELATGRVIGCEALVRWRHPGCGLLYPNQFIPMAEESGAIIRLGEWGLQEVCRQLKIWQGEGLVVGRIAVNLSTVQFRYPEFASIVDGILRDASIDTTCLELEITESLAMENPELAAAIVAQLNKLGVRMAIDDFGTGYSSLSYLKRFPVQTLKIDRSLIDELATSRCDAAITIAVIELGHSLGMEVLAEGIETQDQLDFLRRHRCDLGQGTSFAAAMPPAEFAAYLRQSAVSEAI